LWLVATARRYGSHDPEDIAHTIIERALRHGTAFSHPYGYWRRAAYNEVVSEARHREIEGRHLAEYQGASIEPLEQQRENAKARLRKACGIIGIGKLLWLARYSRHRNHTGSERVKAHRLRQRLKEGTHEL